MSEEEKDEPPKIIVDEDWKKKAEAEKQALEEEIAAKAKEEAKEEASEPEQGESSEGADYELPPASFPGLLQELSMRAQVSLGLVPNPFTKEPQVDLKAAAYSIDMLAVLQEKTEGNLEEQEATYLTQLTAQLREVFVKISSGAAGEEGAGEQGEAAEGEAAEGEAAEGEAAEG